jgi:hypothetical protein
MIPDCVSRRAGILVAAAALVAGCGGGGGGGAIPLADLSTRMADVACQSNACGTYPDQASCRAAASRSNIPRLQAAVAAGKTKYDGVAAAACLDALGPAIGACRLSALFVDLPPACAAAFTGTGAAGADCLFDLECVSQLCDRSACDAVAECCHGTCLDGPAPQLRQEGAPCGAADTCAAGTFCDTTLATPTCVPAKPAGQACRSGDACVAGHVCLPTSLADAAAGVGTCTKPPGEGETCTISGTCDLRTDFCDAVTSKCTPRIAVGSPCDPASLEDGCVGYGICDQTTVTCRARGRDGEDCNPATSSGACLETLGCDATSLTCMLPDAPPLCGVP